MDERFIFPKLWRLQVIPAASTGHPEPLASVSANIPAEGGGYFSSTFISIMGCYGDSLWRWCHVCMN